LHEVRLGVGVGQPVLRPSGRHCSRASATGIVTAVPARVTSGTPIFGICLVYTMYIPCICRPRRYYYGDIHGIFVVYPWIYHGYPTECIYMVYSWIYHVYRPSIYLVYPWIYMVYHLTHIVPYTWYIRGISMDMPSFL
jgi:hypothetical protein